MTGTALTGSALTGMALAVRRAAFDDLAWILALERATPTASHWDESAYAAALAAEAEVPRCVLVATWMGGPVGFAVGSLAAGAGELESVVVREDARRRGAGRALVEAVVGWARGRGAGEVVLEVRASSAGARRLYSAAGFTQAGLRRAYYRDPEDDGVVMVWKHT